MGLQEMEEEPKSKGNEQFQQRKAKGVREE